MFASTQIGFRVYVTEAEVKPQPGNIQEPVQVTNSRMFRMFRNMCFFFVFL